MVPLVPVDTELSVCDELQAVSPKLAIVAIVTVKSVLLDELLTICLGVFLKALSIGIDDTWSDDIAGIPYYK